MSHTKDKVKDAIDAGATKAKHAADKVAGAAKNAAQNVGEKYQFTTSAGLRLTEVSH